MTDGRAPRTRSERSMAFSGSGAPATTDEQAELAAAAASAQSAVDAETLRRAREIAARLAVPRPRRATAQYRRRPGGRGEVASVPYRGGSDDIDLDRTHGAARRASRARGRGHHRPRAGHHDALRGAARGPVRVHARRAGPHRRGRRRRARRGTGAGQPRGRRVLVGRGGPGAPRAARAAGTAGGGDAGDPGARAHQRGVPAAGGARASSPGCPRGTPGCCCFPTACTTPGPTREPFAARLPRLDILLDTTGEQDPELARDLARLGRGRLRQVRTYRDVAPALSDFFTG